MTQKKHWGPGGHLVRDTRVRRKPKKAEWEGLCPAGRHGIDYEGQHCDLCPHPPISLGDLSEQVETDLDRLVESGYYGATREEAARQLFLQALREEIQRNRTP